MSEQEVLADLAKQLRQMASVEFDQNGPHDARGAAIWDVASFIMEDYAPARSDHDALRTVISGLRSEAQRLREAGK